MVVRSVVLRSAHVQAGNCNQYVDIYRAPAKHYYRQVWAIIGSKRYFLADRLVYEQDRNFLKGTKEGVRGTSVPQQGPGVEPQKREKDVEYLTVLFLLLHCSVFGCIC